MSHGPGVIEDAIIRSVQRALSPRTYGQHLWEVAEERDSVRPEAVFAPGVETGQIERSFYKSFNRAVRNLQKDKEIGREDLPLAGVEDVVRHYPYKTLKLEVRSLRQLLIPELAQYASRRSQFSDREVEARVLAATMDVRASDFSDCCGAWSEIEDRLWRIGANASGRTEVLGLLLAGRRCFSVGAGRYALPSPDPSLREVIDAAGGVLDAETRAAIDEVYGRAFPEADVAAKRTKGWLFAVVDFGSRGPATIKPEALFWILGRQGELVRGLPGFVEAQPKGPIWFDRPQPAVFPELVRRMIDHNVFQKFEFLTPSVAGSAEGSRGPGG